MAERVLGTLGSLFAGIGGFELALQEWWNLGWQVENNRQCNRLLDHRFPRRRAFGDIRCCWDELPACELLTAGDPCQCRSTCRNKAPRGHRKAQDYAGYVLAVAHRLRPRWVIRENVVSPDVVHTAAGLDSIGYRTCIVYLDGADFTACSRKRHFVVGCLDHSVHRKFEGRVAEHEDSGRNDPKSTTNRPCILPCLLASDGGKQFSSDSGYVWERERGVLRKLAPEERERALGYPPGWTSGFAPTRRGHMLGNSVNIKCVRWLGLHMAIAETLQATEGEDG